MKQSDERIESLELSGSELDETEASAPEGIVSRQAPSVETVDKQRVEAQAFGRDYAALRLAVERLLFGVSLLVLWEMASGTLIDARTFSSPTAIGRQLVDWALDGRLARHTWVTLRTTIYGFALGAGLALISGLGLGLSRRIGDIVTPYILILYALPKLALVPLFILWFGIGTQMKVVMSAVLVFFLVFLNTVAGVRDVDLDLVDSLRVMGARRRDVLWKLTIPGAMSHIILGFRMAVPYALIGAVVGEMMATTSGLGYVLMFASAAYNTAGVFGVLAVLGAIAFVMNQAVELLERRVLRWKERAGEDDLGGFAPV